MLRIRTLGGLSVQSAGRTASGATVQPRRLAVLALIARAGERGITRDRVLTTLWPDADEEAARRSLTQALYALRRDLDADELFLGVQELRLNPDAATCDVVEFESVLAGRNLDRAAELYTGPFLDGFRLPGAAEFDRWVDDERNSLAHRYIDVLERLARRAAERGDPTDASAWWRRMAQLDPLNARIALELMRALVAAGDPSGALNHARIYEALLAQELDLEPDRQVVELARRIREEATAAATALPLPAAASVPVVSAPALSAPVASAAAEPLPAPSSPAPNVAAAPPIVAAPAPPRRERRTVVLAAAAVALLLLVSVAAWWRGISARNGRVTLLAVGGIVDYRTAERREADAVNDMLATNLARVKGLQVLSSARLYEVMGRIEGTPESRGVMAARAAQQAGATELLEGAIHSLRDGQLVLDLRRINLRTGAVRNAYRVQGSDEYALVSQATEELARSLDLPASRLDPRDVSTRSLVAYRFYEEGLRSYGRGDFRSAERLLGAAVAEDSGFAMAAFYLSTTRTALGTPQPPDTWDRLVRLAENAPDRERLLIRATWAQATERPERYAIIDTLAVRYPAEVDGPFLQGSVRLQNAEYRAAIPYLQRALAMDSLGLGGASPRCRACDALEHLLYAYTSIDSMVAAERLVRDYVRLQPRSARAWVVLAGVLIVSERYEEGLDAYRTAMSMNPVNQYDRVFPAIVRVRRGEFEDADRLLKSLVSDAGGVDANEGNWLLTISLRYQGRWQEALDLLRANFAALPPAQRTDQQGLGVKINEALVLFESGRAREAAVLWDSIARNSLRNLRPNVSIARARTFHYTMLATALAAAGDTVRLRAAVDSVASWAGRSTNRRDAHLVDHARGLLLRARGDTAGALAALERAIHSPTNGFTRTNRELGALLLARHQPNDVVRVVGAALRGGSLESGNLYVTHTDLHELLARAFDEAGKPDSAVTHYRYVVAALARSDPQTRPRHDAARLRLETLTRRR